MVMFETGSHGVNFEQFLKLVCMEGGGVKGAVEFPSIFYCFFRNISVFCGVNTHDKCQT